MIIEHNIKKHAENINASKKWRQYQQLTYEVNRLHYKSRLFKLA